MLKYKPLGSRVLVKILTKTEIKVAGQTLLVAKGVNKYGKTKHEWNEEVLRALVLRRGEDATDIEDGDVVLIDGAAGKHVDWDISESTDTHRVIYQDEIIAVDVEETESLKNKQETANV